MTDAEFQSVTDLLAAVTSDMLRLIWLTGMRLLLPFAQLHVRLTQLARDLFWTVPLLHLRIPSGSRPAGSSHITWISSRGGGQKARARATRSDRNRVDNPPKQV